MRVNYGEIDFLNPIRSRGFFLSFIFLSFKENFSKERNYSLEGSEASMCD